MKYVSLCSPHFTDEEIKGEVIGQQMTDLGFIRLSSKFKLLIPMFCGVPRFCIVLAYAHGLIAL